MRSQISSLIRYILPGFRSGVFLSTSVLIILALAIWFVGPDFRYMDYKPFDPVLNRVIAIVALIVLWGINNYFLARRNARKRPKKAEAEAPLPQDYVGELIELLRSSFRNTMSTIKNKWTGKSAFGRSVYALPWYLVLGPSDSGKTSLVSETDLTFPLGHILNDPKQLSAIGARELPQYWVTSESVLFDVPGSWMDPASQVGPLCASPQNEGDGATALSDPSTPIMTVEGRKRLWTAFLDLINEYRPRRPINGVILCYDVMDLVRMTDTQRMDAAGALHARLVEIAERLGTRFTLHIVLTKLDRIAGFREFFSQFSKYERNQPFGFSFPVYDEISTDKWVDDFNRDFTAFIEQVNDDMLERLYLQRETENRRGIYTFVREMAAMGVIVSDFFKRALAGDSFSTPPQVRGLYLSSVKQEGVPFNALLHRIANDYHMRAPVMPAYSGHSTRYFIDGLFQRVIFKEAGLAGDNKAVERRKRMVLNGTVVASVLGLLGLTFLLTQAMQDNVARAEKVLEASRDFVNLPLHPKAGNEDDESWYLPALNAISTANRVFPGWQEKSGARRYLALYQGRRVGTRVTQAYEELLDREFVPTLARRARSKVDQLGRTPDTAMSDERLDALRVYLLLGDVNRRKELDSSTETQSLGKKAIFVWMQDVWQTRYEGKVTVQQDLARHLEYALATNRISAPLEQDTVSRAQASLREIPRDVRLYRSLRSLAERQVPAGVSFRSQLGPSFDIVFKQNGDEGAFKRDIVIPYFYTRAGFRDFFVPKNEALSVIAVEDAWVTGERERVQYSPDDLEAFRDKIRHAYATDYINIWQNALGGLEVVKFRNVDDATRVFTEINGPSNPFGRLLSMVKAQTEIYPATPVDTAEEQTRTDIGFDKNQEQGKRITRAFADLSRIVTLQDDKKSFMEELMVPTGEMETYLRSILGGQQSSKPVALERAQARARLEGDDPIFILRRTGSNLPKPFDKLYSQLADNSWEVVLAAAKADLQTVWQNNVYRTFNASLATHYPFSSGAKDEVSLTEFQRFFGPEGEFDRFFTQYLSTFIDEYSGKAVVIDGKSLDVSQDFLDQIATIRKVRDIFFTSEGVPTLLYTVEPLSLSGSMSKATLNIEGQLIPYSHGPTRPISVLWPNALSSKQDVSQVSVAGSLPGQLSYQGLWSSFRLFERAAISDVRADSVDVTFNVGGGRVKYRLRMARSDHNPFALRPLTSLKLPEQL